MRGSLAVWYDPTGPGRRAARLDLHFNLWLDLPGPPDALDIGFQFEEPVAFGALYFYTPGVVNLEFIEDLSGILQDNSTLSAIFNDTLAVGSVSEKAFEAKKGNEVKLQVVKLAIDQHIHLEKVGDGTVIKIARSAFERFVERGEYYIRIRIKLFGELTRVFRDDFYPTERIFLSAFYRTDVAEFRVNERRNFSAALKARYPIMEMPAIRVIQYFLVRSIATELILSHADFRKIRRLEPGLWDHYLEGLGQVSAERMVIYHWRAGPDENNPVEDFIALAWFRTPRQNLLLFLAAFVGLGAAGSATQSLLTKAGVAIKLEDNWLLQLLIVLLLVLCIIVTYFLMAHWRGAWERVAVIWRSAWQRVKQIHGS